MHTNLHNQRSVCPQTGPGMHMSRKQTTSLEEPMLKVFEVDSSNTHNLEGIIYNSETEFFLKINYE